MTRYDPFDGASRRDFLKATGVAGTTPALGGLAAGQETDDDDEAEAEDATTILLGGEVNHWFGLAPEAIHEAENPTLTLEEGQDYRIIWMNLDGREHELIVEDADGEELVASDSNEEVGATASVTFTASEEMAEYYCEYHPESMRGGVELGEGFETATPEGTETPTEDGNEGNGNESDEGDEEPY